MKQATKKYIEKSIRDIVDDNTAFKHGYCFGMLGALMIHNIITIDEYDIYCALTRQTYISRVEKPEEPT